ncbi:MAG: PqqD family peptide modification chaperone [Phycisphaerales bacterium]|jgi:putative peptide zinc metalloprotease protein
MAGQRGRDIASTFSDLWYRIGPTTPRLSAHARVVRQHYGPTIAYIVEDPASGQFYRMSESAHFFLGMLDGKTTVDQAWEACNDQLGDAAPTQREVLDLLSRLQLFGLVLGESALDAEMLEQRLAKASRQRTQKRTGRWMFPHVPIVNPEPWLRRHEKICRALFSPVAGVSWAILVSVALVLVFANADRFGDALNSVAQLAPSTLITIGLIFLGLRIVHELGHAMACKAFGGRSTEIGVILIAYVLPLPYCEASSAWRFARVWPRVCVSLAGVLAETVIAAVCAIYWAIGSDAVLQSVAYQVMLVSGVSTFVFNLNPLLRYDGYYILSDLTGTPNLAQRSREMLKYLIQRYPFGLKGARGPAIRSLGEGWLLAIYGLLATPYRIFVAVAILLVIASKYLTFGVALAVAMGAIWLVYPVLKSAGFVLSDPKLEGHRGRAIAVSLAALALVFGPILLIPLPTPTYAVATVEPARLDGLRTLEEGTLAELLVEPGDRVEEGQLVARLENVALKSELEAALARQEQARTQYRASLQRPPAEQEEYRQAIRVVDAQVARLQRRIEHLDVRAPVAGVVSPISGQTSADLRSVIGSFVPRGTALGMVVSEDDLLVRAMVPDRDHAFVFRGQSQEDVQAAVRLESAPGRVIQADVRRVAALGSKELTSASLAAEAGGGVTTDPRESERSIALTPSFVVDLTMQQATPAAAPGVRASVRLEGPSRPLGARWWRRATQFFEGRSWW